MMRSCIPVILFLLMSVLFLQGCTDTGMPASESQSNGQGGSLARFAIRNNMIYTLSGEKLSGYDISQPANTIPQFSIFVGADLETIFIREQLLFIGSVNGLYIFDISNPVSPALRSNYTHITSCDPVIADSMYAYITLNNSAQSFCRRGLNQLEIIDIRNPDNPSLLKVYPLTSPRGLGKDDSLLFVCDNGLSVYDARNVNSLVLLQKFNIQAEDVIAANGHLIVTGSSGIYQYNYQSGALHLLSYIPTQE